MTIGIPRALLYYRYGTLWKTFFEALDCQVIVSGPTTKQMMDRGSMLAIDEACLSSKIFLGHVDALVGKCDYIFVPRISNFGRNSILCTKFEALHDIVTNTFRGRGIKVLGCNIDIKNGHSEMSEFFYIGKKLGKKKQRVLFAYMAAKQAERAEKSEAVYKQNLLLDKPGERILLVGHSYNLHDPFMGRPVVDYLESMGITLIYADVADSKKAIDKSLEISDTLPWLYNQELLGGLGLYKDKVDGIILISAFPCGPDSLVNEIILRRVKHKPVLTLMLDSQQGNAGIETRLESFIDIIRFQKEGMLQ